VDRFGEYGLWYVNGCFRRMVNYVISMAAFGNTYEYIAMIML
jgi:hypothetical protein